MTTVAELAVQLVLDADDYISGINDAVKATDEVADSVESAGKEVAGFSNELDKSSGKLSKSVKDELLGPLKKMQAETAELKKKAIDLSKGLNTTGKAAAGAGKGFGSLAKVAVTLGVAIGGAALVGGLVKFGKASIDAARDAGHGAVMFSQLEKATDRLKVAVGAGFVAAVESSGQSLARWLDNLAEAVEAESALIKATKEGEIAFSAQAAAIINAVFFGEDLVDMARNLGVEFENASDGISVTTDALDDYVDQFIRLKGLDKSGLVDLQLLIEARDDLLDKEKADAAAKAYKNFFDSIKQGITGEAESLLVGLKFEDLGGDEILNTLQTIKNAFEKGAITRDEFRKFMGLQFAEEEAMKVAQGMQSAFEAAINVADILGITPEEARKLIDDALAGVDLVSDADVQLATDAAAIKAWQDDVQALLDGKEFEATPKVESPTLRESGEMLQRFLEDLDTADNFIAEVVVHTTYTSTGTPPNTSSTTGTESTKPGAAHGADFVVPPGFPNDSFGLNVESGERVQVTPANQVRGGDRNMTIAEQNFFGVDVDDVAEMMENQEFLE